MKQYIKKIIIFSMSIILLFVSCPFSVYASDHGGSGGTDHNPDFITDSGTINVEDDGVVMYYIEYILANIGAVLCDHDLSKVMANDQTMKEYISKGKFDANKNTVTFPKDTVTYVYNTFNTIAKENEPYYMVNTLTLDNFLGSSYAGNKIMYDTAKNLLEDSPSGVIAFGAYYMQPTQMYFVNIGHYFKNISPVKAGSTNRLTFYNNETWGQETFLAYNVNLTVEDEAIKTAEEFRSKADYTWNYGTDFNRPICYLFGVYPDGNTPGIYAYDCRGYTGYLKLVTRERRRIRVFNTYADFQNYTLGKRSVYYTSNYYDYVPEDLTTSIDDLQQTVDDLSGVIDQLLGQITKDTDESEIEDLLKQILDELKNNQGSGGGGGGGDVNVDIDLSTTNTLLSKILAKVTQIFDRMSETAEGAVDTAHAKIQETLDEMLVQVKKLKHWTMADTAVNAADAVADWLDFIKGIFDDAENGAGNAVSALSATMGDAANLMKTKFPFCIPWDVYLIIGFLAEEPQTPVFRLPIKLERLGIDEYMEVNLEDFEIVSSISRTILTLAYCYGLLNLTMKVFPIAKEGD